ALDAPGWRAILAEAARSGLLSELGPGLYALHPTLSPYLRSRLAAQAGEAGVRRLDAEYARSYAAISLLLFDGARHADRRAIDLLTFEEPNLLRAMKIAELAEDWPRAQNIAETIGSQYQSQARLAEWRRLRDGFLDRLGVDAMTEKPPAELADLWMYLL